MYSTEFDSGCLVCFIEIISWADPQWEIPLYVWLKIWGLSRSSSCFRPAHPSWGRDLQFFTSIKSETTSIPVFFLESTPPPHPLLECLPFIPDPVNICVAGIQVFLLRTGTFSAINGNRLMTLIRITGTVTNKSSLKFLFLVQNRRLRSCLKIHKTPDGTCGKQIIGITIFKLWPAKQAPVF